MGSVQPCRAGSGKHGRGGNKGKGSRRSRRLMAGAMLNSSSSQEGLPKPLIAEGVIPTSQECKVVSAWRTSWQ
eukprot:4013823-Prorocentrum_lima.AAC.1